MSRASHPTVTSAPHGIATGLSGRFGALARPDRAKAGQVTFALSHAGHLA